VRAHRRGAGFTLVELLAVILILGIVLSMAALSINRRGREDVALDIARRVALVCQALADEAVYRARPLGIDLARDGYRIVEYRAGAWRTAATDIAAYTLELPAGIEFRGPQGGTYAASEQPDLVLLPNGDFRLRPVIIGDRSSPASVRLEPRAGGRLFTVVGGPQP
jgi:general secretion pathway protein H